MMSRKLAWAGSNFSVNEHTSQKHLAVHLAVSFAADAVALLCAPSLPSLLLVNMEGKVHIYLGLFIYLGHKPVLCMKTKCLWKKKGNRLPHKNT